MRIYRINKFVSTRLVSPRNLLERHLKPKMLSAERMGVAKVSKATKVAAAIKAAPVAEGWYGSCTAAVAGGTAGIAATHQPA